MVVEAMVGVGDASCWCGCMAWRVVEGANGRAAAEGHAQRPAVGLSGAKAKATATVSDSHSHPGQSDRVATRVAAAAPPLIHVCVHVWNVLVHVPTCMNSGERSDVGGLRRLPALGRPSADQWARRHDRADRTAVPLRHPCGRTRMASHGAIQASHSVTALSSTRQQRSAAQRIAYRRTGRSASDAIGTRPFENLQLPVPQTITETDPTRQQQKRAPKTTKAKQTEQKKNE